MVTRVRGLGEIAGLGVALLVADCSSPTVTVLPMEGLEGFEAELDQLRVSLQIPGLSAAIAQDGEIVWSKGFGYADVREDKPASPTTSFHLASLTKIFAATIVMQLVEDGQLDLDAPISDYGVDLSSQGTILVRHLMTHTSEGTPGAAFKYNGNRFGELGKVIEGASGRTFGELLVERILQPLGLPHTAPNVKDDDNFRLTGFDRNEFIDNMATGYELSDGEVKEKDYPSLFGPAAGLIGSVEDVAAYSLAIDQRQFLQPETWEEMLTPATAPNGEPLAYGLGWFIHFHEDIKFEWHYGWWTANSSLIVRVPERGLTFVVAANSDAMSSRYGLGGDSDLLRSDVARLFVESFVLGDEVIPGTN